MKTPISSSVKTFWTSTVAIALIGIAGCQNQTKWAGTWELKDPSSEQTVKVVLSEDGKVYMIPPDLFQQGEKKAYELPLTRVSDETKVPEGYTVTNLAEEIEKQTQLAKQEEGKQYVGSMLRAQQAYHLENAKFANNLEELQIPINPETENFIYKIVPQSDTKKSVLITAQAKSPDLKSYAGAAYSVKENNEETTKVIVCESNENSTTPPAMPTLTGTELKCPDGSTALQ